MQDEAERSGGALFAWRLAALEDAALTREEAQNMFVTREEQRRERAHRREWPIVLASIVMAASSLINVLGARGGH
jgi:hypothetical protein